MALRKNKGPIDAAAELARVRAARLLCRRRRRRPAAALRPHTTAMQALRGEGASYEDIRHWLENSQRLKVSEATVRRWLHRHDGGGGNGTR